MKIIWIAVFLCFCFCSKAQEYDAQWVIGPNASVLDFRTPDTVKLDSLAYANVWFLLTSACISDDSGNLLYTCYGPCATDKNGYGLSNGCGLSPCTYSADNPAGFAIQQAALFLPEPGNSRYYYLFHFSNDTLDNQRPGTIYYSMIDKEGNGGLGAVTSKNNPILSGVILRGGGMTACKHANGRDYWLIMGASVIDTFYKFLITPDTIYGPYIQGIGPQFPLNDDNAYSKFSQDGTKFATGTYEHDSVLLMDFDRCSGKFSNPMTIYHNASYNPNSDPISGCASLEFSGNGQYLYVNNFDDLTQYDLLSSNIQDSIELYVSDSADFYQLGMLQLAPNGKLYCSTWNGGLHAMHVINYPDLKGDSADFVYGGQPTWSDNSFNVPNLINYKLGPLVGSGCDTIPTDIKQQTQDERLLRVLPNPADKYIYVEMGMQGDYEFDLLNETGQVMAKRETRQVDNFDTDGLSSGVYYLRAFDKATNLTITKKVVLVH